MGQFLGLRVRGAQRRKEEGAVGLWCQDKELKVYKTLFYLINEQGLSLSVLAMNLPPFNALKSARPMTWRLQAFDKSWVRAAARFRDWRVKNVKIPPRPDWVRKLAFMEYGMDKASPVNETVMLAKYFGGKGLGPSAHLGAGGGRGGIRQ